MFHYMILYENYTKVKIVKKNPMQQNFKLISQKIGININTN